MNTVTIEPTLAQQIGAPFFLEWQVQHYTQRLEQARRKTDNTQERAFLRRTLHGLKQALAAKLN